VDHRTWEQIAYREECEWRAVDEYEPDQRTARLIAVVDHLWIAGPCTVRDLSEALLASYYDVHTALVCAEGLGCVASDDSAWPWLWDLA
jgi:hypothetical protein